MKICLFVKWRLFRSSYRNLAWAEFKPTTVTGHKWLVTHKVFISCRSKIKVIYILSRLSPQWRRGNSCTQAHDQRNKKELNKTNEIWELCLSWISYDQLWPLMIYMWLLVNISMKIWIHSIFVFYNYFSFKQKTAYGILC